MPEQASRNDAHVGPRIAVVGGGIGGLSAAAFLHQAGLDVTVFEQAKALREVGAGLVVSPNAVRLLRRLGVMDRLREVAVVLDVGWEFRRWRDGRVLFSQKLGAVSESRYGAPSLVAHRADLLDAIRRAVPDRLIRLGARCVETRPTPRGAELIFADGDTSEYDVVVGADGLHSVVASSIGAAEVPRFSGLCAYRCLVPADRAPAFALNPSQTIWLGPGRHLVHYPVSQGRLVNVVAFAPAHGWTEESWSAEGRMEDLIGEFDGWDGRLLALLRAADRTGRWALLERDPLPRWTAGAITLLGDAAHPMFPFLAQGAAQAVEDAAVLAQCLQRVVASAATVPDALEQYERLRRPRATRVQQLSRGRERENHLPDGPEQRARDLALTSADPLTHNDWLYGFDVQQDLDLDRPVTGTRGVTRRHPRGHARAVVIGDEDSSERGGFSD